MNQITLFPLPVTQQDNGNHRRCTALFLFRNTEDPGSRFYKPRAHSQAMWWAIRYYMTQSPLRQPCNLPLMDYVLCPPQWQVQRFENHSFAAVLRGVEGKIPQRLECRVPDAELIVMDGSPAETLAKLEQGWIPQPNQKAPVITMGAKAAVA